MLQQWSWNFPTAIPVAMPIGLKHVDSEVCWCEPIIEVDAEEILVADLPPQDEERASAGEEGDMAFASGQRRRAP